MLLAYFRPGFCQLFCPHSRSCLPIPSPFWSPYIRAGQLRSGASTRAQSWRSMQNLLDARVFIRQTTHLPHTASTFWMKLVGTGELWEIFGAEMWISYRMAKAIGSSAPCDSLSAADVLRTGVAGSRSTRSKSWLTHLLTKRDMSCMSAVSP